MYTCGSDGIFAPYSNRFMPNWEYSIRTIVHISQLFSCSWNVQRVTIPGGYFNDIVYSQCKHYVISGLHEWNMVVHRLRWYDFVDEAPQLRNICTRITRADRTHNRFTKNNLIEIAVGNGMDWIRYSEISPQTFACNKFHPILKVVFAVGLLPYPIVAILEFYCHLY